MFAWSSKYSVGIDEIDKQHQKLIKITNDIVELIGEKKSPLIAIKVQELEDYAKWHFQTEMMYVKKCKQCSNSQLVEEHDKEHKEILEKIDVFKQDIGNFDTDCAAQLIVFIKKWFVNHILITDKELYDFLREQNLEEIIITDKKI